MSSPLMFRPLLVSGGAYRITVPKLAREQLGWKEHDTILFEVMPDDTMRLRKVTAEQFTHPPMMGAA